MTERYVLAPEAALDLVEIWRYLRKQGSVEVADRPPTEFVQFPGPSPRELLRRTP
jgi:hypothetical protein